MKNNIILGDYLSILDKILKYSKNKIFILTDENTSKKCLPYFLRKLPTSFSYKEIKLKAGEEQKNLATAESIWQYLLDNQIDRKSLIINLGGGVITDIGGFVATTIKRGVDFINVPTTILAQVDASIGGKNGVNFHSYKNQIGTIKEAESIFIDGNFLKTLDKRNILSGFAEMIKHALLDSKEHFDYLKNLRLDKINDEFLEAIRMSIKVKQKIVEKDKYENNVRMMLNFGHTIGHAFESHFLKSGMLHGEAVACGMIAELHLSELQTNKKGCFVEVSNFIKENYKIKKIEKQDFEKLYNLMLYDKKNENKKINFALIEDFGKFILNANFSKKEIFDSFEAAF